MNSSATIFRRTTIASLVCFSATLWSCSTSPPTSQQTNLITAETLIDAFYSFEANKLQPFFVNAQASAPALMFYQGWAEGGNYKIVNRAPCAVQESGNIDCAITVEDDPVLQLNTNFNVTDTFTLTFDNGVLTAVETNSNDQQIYYDAFDWVVENMPEVMAGPCQGFFNGGPTPGDCARAMTEGYRQFAASDAYPN